MLGRWLVIIGFVLIVLGLILQWVPGVFSWFGRLPGDIHIETQRGQLFIPITSMIIISLVVSLLVQIFKR